ncbi:MAG: caspase family protein [Hyphomicrobiales bacterium]
MVFARSLVVAAALLVFATPGFAQKRVALVVGNGSYAHSGVLPNPTNDASDIADALEAVGFSVIRAIDVDRRGFDRKVRDFSAELADAADAVFFYAGHGLQVAGQNYLIPVDAKLSSERDLDFEALPLNFVLRQMELQREGRTNVVFLDACRDNPLARNLARSMGTRSSSVGRGLAQVKTGVGTFIAFSTQPGNVAFDGDGRNSPFTAALVKRIGTTGRSLAAMMIEVRNDVLATTGGKQVPWDHSALTGDFYFNPEGGQQPASKTAAKPGAEDAARLEQRIRELEEKLQEKTDASDMATAVQLAQLKERVRRLDEDMKLDMQTIFRLQREGFKLTDQGEKAKLRSEVSRMHLQMARKGQERKKLKELIAGLEKKADPETEK